MTEDGSLLSTDKYIWSQARWAWVCSALYNRVDPRKEFLDAARSTVHFLLNHGRDSDGRFVYHTTQTGEVVAGPISIYSDCFAVYGFNEYYRATRDKEVLKVALDTFHTIVRRVEEPGFKDVAPSVLLPGRRPHAIPMILTETANELAITTGDAAIEAKAEKYALTVMHHFVRPEWQVLVEYLSRDYQLLPPPEGTAVEPGHAIECMWFILHWAIRVNRADIVQQAVEVIRWHVEKGWDEEYGGLLLAIDAQGNAPFIANSDKKVWWPHTEALYALLLAHQLTLQPWCLEWYWRIHEWSFRHFHRPDAGEWRQRLTRSGEPIDELIALPVKDPFHLPRAVILILGLLSRADHGLTPPSIAV